MANKKKRNKRNRLKFYEDKRREMKGLSFVHNGIKYQRSKDTVLVRVKDVEDNKYLGIEINKSKNVILMENIHKTNEYGAFIFMLDKKVFEEFGVSTTIKMLKDENLSLDSFSGIYQYEVI